MGFSRVILQGVDCGGQGARKKSPNSRPIARLPGKPGFKPIPAARARQRYIFPVNKISRQTKKKLGAIYRTSRYSYARPSAPRAIHHRRNHHRPLPFSPLFPRAPAFLRALPPFSALFLFSSLVSPFFFRKRESTAAVVNCRMKNCRRIIIKLRAALASVSRRRVGLTSRANTSLLNEYRQRSTERWKRVCYAGGRNKSRRRHPGNLSSRRNGETRAIRLIEITMVVDRVCCLSISRLGNQIKLLLQGPIEFFRREGNSDRRDRSMPITPSNFYLQREPA